ncbi:SURF1 family cytochrome oxidase biogenesis protein [Solimonas sp. K1W22B-7]|uniref:SURF1 family cytochrome oxidase biogenesis protein n=1 Tax=Solimonas sp. K1W22B-7 TaxID=2303331 RepID=UPI0013C4FCB9|nr:SURF1 family cytochrome oxidase biogenesis protein [Solimonas sp. K1W22B-7]
MASHGLRVLALGVVALGVAAGGAWYGLQQQKLAQAASADLALYESAQTRTPLVLTSRAAAVEGLVERGSVVGKLVPAKQLLVPRLQADGRKGYDLWLALEYTPGTGGMNGSGEFVIVNRGWIAESEVSDAAKFRVPDSEGEFSGYWVPLPLSADNELGAETCLDTSWPKTLRTPNPTFGDMKCLFNSQQIAQGLLMLTTELGEGADRNWTGQRQAIVKRYQTMVYGAFGAAALALLLWLGFAILGRPRPAVAAPAPAPAAPAATETPAEEAPAGAKHHHPHAPLGKLQR